jgi:hypothetical protein
MSQPSEAERRQEVPAEIKQVLDAVIMRIRRVWLLRGCAAVATTLVAGLLLAVGLDWLAGGLSTAARWPLLMAVLLAVAGTIHRWVWKPMRRKLPLLRVAGWLESHHPELDERLSSAVGMPERGKGVSAVLLDALVAAAVVDVKSLDPDHEVNRSSLKRWVRPLAAIGCVWLVLFVVSPGTMARLLARTINPFSQLGNAGALHFLVRPGDMEVLEGEEVRISIEASGRVPESLTLRIEAEDRVPVEERLRRGADGRFGYFLAQAERSFRFQVRDGREMSDSFQVKVWPKPVVSDARLVLNFPEYTGMEAFQVSVPGELEVLAHTRITLTGKVPEGVTGGVLSDGTKSIPLMMQPDGGIEVSFSAEPGASGLRTVTLNHVTGKKLEGWKAVLTVKADNPPVIALLAPKGGELRVNRDDVLPIDFQASDDIRVETIGYELKIDGAAEIAWPLEREVAPGRSIIERDRLNLSALARKNPQMREVRLRMVAKDGLPPAFGGPGIGRSGELLLRIEDGAKSIAGEQVKERYEEARKDLDDAARQINEAREKLAQVQRQLDKEAIPQEAQQRFAEVDKGLESAGEKLQEVAKNAPAVADLATEAAKKSEDARDEATAAPLQDSARDRQVAAEKSRMHAEEALRKIEAIRRAMDKASQDAEKQAQLNELAMQERALSREAAENAAKDPQAKQSDDLQRRQEEVARAVAEQLKTNPKAQAEHAARQAEALAVRAREAAANQETLEKQAEAAATKSSAEPPAAGAGEAAAIAKEAKALGDKPTAPQAAGQAAVQAEAAAEAAKAGAAAAEKGQQEQAAAEHAKAAQDMKAAARKLRDAAAQPGQEPAAAAAATALGERAAQEAGRQQALQAQAEASTAADAMQAAQKNASEEASAVAAAAVNLGQEAAAARPARPAVQQAQQAAKAAQQAMESGKQGAPANAAPQHGKAAEALAAAAKGFDQAAAAIRQAADKNTPAAAAPGEAAKPSDALAQAAQASSQAAQAQSAAQAARASEQAAAALDLAAAQSPGGAPPSAPQPSQPTESQAPGQGTPAQVGMRDEPVGDVPPELAKLGVSAGDWDKIQASLRSDVGSSGAVVIPEDYRELVKAYFERIAEGDKNR